MNQFLSNKIILILLVGLLLFGFCIRLTNIDRSLWNDEVVSTQFSEYSINRLFPTVEDDPHPGTFYFGLKLWSSFNESETFLRLYPAILEMLAIITGTWLVYMEIGGIASIIFTVLLSVHPASFIISQLLRNYSILSLSTVLTGWSAYRVADDKKTGFRNISLLTGAGIFALYSHFAGIFVIFLTVTYFFGDRLIYRKDWTAEKLYPFTIPLIGWGLASIPILLDILNQPATKWDVPPLTISHLINNYTILLGGFTFLESGTIRFWAGLTLSAGLSLSCIIGFVWVWFNNKGLRPFVSFIFIPIIYFVVAWSQQKAFRLRYTAPFTIPIIVCVSTGINWLLNYIHDQFKIIKPHYKFLLIGLFLLGFFCMNTYRITNTMAVVQRDWKELSSYLKGKDVTVLYENDGKYRKCLSYYLSSEQEIISFSQKNLPQKLSKLTGSTNDPIFFVHDKFQKDSKEILDSFGNLKIVQSFSGQLTLKLYEFNPINK